MGNTMLAADLHRILSDVRPFASKDRTVPAICAIRIESVGDNITAAATDRFTLGISRADYSGEQVAFTVSTSNADNLIRITKTRRQDATWRTVEIQPIGKIKEGYPYHLKFIFSTGEELTVAAETTDFPKFRQLLPDESIDEKAQGNVATQYNAANLAKFAKVAGSETMNVITRGRDCEIGKPSIVTIGDDFIGLIMPTRKEFTPSYTKPAWV